MDDDAELGTEDFLAPNSSLIQPKKSRGQSAKELDSKVQSCPRGNAHHTKPDIAVRAAGLVPVAVRGATVLRIVVPGAAAFDCLPHLSIDEN